MDITFCFKKNPILSSIRSIRGQHLNFESILWRTFTKERWHINSEAFSFLCSCLVTPKFECNFIKCFTLLHFDWAWVTDRGTDWLTGYELHLMMILRVVCLRLYTSNIHYFSSRFIDAGYERFSQNFCHLKALYHISMYLAHRIQKPILNKRIRIFTNFLTN